ncbi:hypothetical protein BDB00DRAFT_841337 [Zychaea mexicana]|uniref:uncharacterized protein n=1 Tax=Zychaea mexicana TaxID=64656 RepID=UPI0022FF28F7|nr:uncharacterized protein BDB00DRAFT_841337 [Zychaea mexicana]KAI9489770.1 hypothetical protein BDB00DRAFT_841337 [Zychaea mexicana]
MRKSVLLIALLAFEQALAQTPTSSAASNLQTPTSNFPWKEAYPPPLLAPSPKTEWVQALSNATIANAPVGNRGVAGNDPYCHWTSTQCKRPSDIYTCEQGHWGLSFDDGPTIASPPLYDFLKQQNLKATFFLIGGNVIQYPDMVKKMHEDGHEIAIHTWSHTQLTTQTNEQIVAELKWTEQAIKEIIGVSPVLVRPPQGDMDDRVRNITEQLGFKIAIWSHDTFDWEIGTNPTVTPQSIEQEVTSWLNTATGGISLQHDRVNETVNVAINTVVPLLKGKYEMSTVAACANMSAEDVYKETAGSGNQSSGNGGEGAASALMPAAFFVAFSAVAASIVSSAL